jgi:hypothetical protein
MAIYKYPDEVKQFIANNVVGKTAKELAELVNSKFGTEFTPSKMKSYKTNHGFKSGTKPGIEKGQPTDLYPDYVQDFIFNNYKGTGHQEMANLLNDKFGTTYTKTHIKSFYGNRNLNSGLTGRFEKGITPPNKGKKGYCSPGCEKGWFKKGDFSHNRLPIGSERISADGYTYIKIRDGKFNNNWQAKHVAIWEKYNGPLPEGCCILFGDRNRQNFSINNLICVTRAQLARLNQNHLIQNDAELTRTGVIIADLFQKMKDVTR